MDETVPSIVEAAVVTSSFTFILPSVESAGLVIVFEGVVRSIPSNIAKMQQFQVSAEFVPLSQLLTETDGPYLTPIAGQVSEPSCVVESIKKIAEMKRTTPEDTKQAIFMNYQKVFL